MGRDRLTPWPHINLPWTREEMPEVIGTIARMVEQENKNKGLKEGWICPRCGKVNAPWVESCTCKPGDSDPLSWMDNFDLEGLKQQLRESPVFDPGKDSVPDLCKACPNHPLNGGSGNCNCMLGDAKVTCDVNGENK